MNNRDELINKVTSEVMKIYGVKSSSDQACVKCTSEISGSSRKPTAISSQPAQLSAISNSATNSELRVPPDSGNKKAIMLLCGNPDLHQESLQHFRSLKARYRKIQVLFSANAQEVYSEAKGRPYFGHEYPIDSMKDLQNWDHFYLINPSLNTLSKIAVMQADNRVALAARKALLWGKPVVIMLDQFPLLPAGMQIEFNRILDKLTEYGYQLQLPQNRSPLPVVTAGSQETLTRSSTTVSTQLIQHPNSSTKTGRIDNLLAPTITSNAQLAQYIDHTLLKPEATKADIEKHCAEARQYEFFSVCVNPAYVPLSAQLLQGSNVKVCTVIGFPLGANTAHLKAEETREIISLGADEVDMVLNIGALKSGDHSLVQRDIEAVVKAAGSTLSKVILETALLTREEILIACRLCMQAGATYVKTSTGFSKGGATAEHIQLMRNAVGNRLGVKASGGIRDTKTAIEMLHAGASRIGASASIAIVEGKDAGAGKY